MQEELKSDFKNVEDKGVVLGGYGVTLKNTLANPYSTIFPFEQISADDMSLIAGPNGMNPSDLGLSSKDDLLTFFTYSAKKATASIEQFTEPNTHQYNLSDFKDEPIDFNQMAEDFKTMKEDLEKTNHWYNSASSSKEYKDFYKAVCDVQKKIQEVGLANQKNDEIFDALSKVNDCAKKYENHVKEDKDVVAYNKAHPNNKKLGKNANQEARFNVASRVELYINQNNLAQKIKVNSALNNAYLTAEQKTTQSQLELDSKNVAQEKEQQIIQNKQNEITNKKVDANLKNAEEQLISNTNPKLNDVLETNVNSRKTLGNLSQQQKPEIKEVEEPLSKLIVTETLMSTIHKKGLENVPDNALSNTGIAHLSNKLKASESFQRSTQNMEGKDLKNVLAESGSKNFAKQMVENGLKKNSKEVEAPDLDITKKNKKEIVVPSLNGNSKGVM